MELGIFLKENGYTINSFANQKGLPATTVWRAVKKRALRPRNATSVSDATGGIVTRMELLYPEEPKSRRKRAA